MDGVNVTAVHQFMKMFKSVCERFNAKAYRLTWDEKLSHGSSNFRKELVEYKEQRVQPENIQEMFATIPAIQDFMDALGVKTVFPNIMEADDVIRFFTKTCSGSTIIVSADQDMLQLVSDDIHLYLPNSDTIVTPANFEEVTKVPQSHFILYKSIFGDVSDNVIGLERFGTVRSKTLALKIYNSDGTIKEDLITPEQAAIIHRNIKVIDLSNTEILVPEEYENYQEQLDKSTTEYDRGFLQTLFNMYKMNDMTRSIGQWTRIFGRNTFNNDLLSQISM